MEINVSVFNAMAPQAALLHNATPYVCNNFCYVV